MPHLDRQSEMELAALLHGQARAIDQPAPTTAELLDRYASRINDQSSVAEALVELDRYAQHYKGLLDVVVPGVSESDWRIFVHSVRRLTRRAMQQRGLDSSIIGRLHGLVGKMRHAP